MTSLIVQLPLHPRTPRQTKLALRSTSHLWAVAYSCGLGVVPAREGEGDTTPLPMPVCEDVVRLAHPACKARSSGLMAAQVYAEVRRRSVSQH